MKKTLWMLGVAVAALTSCTQNEVLDMPENRMIGFEPFVDKTTRAVESISQATDITQFYVFGYHTNKKGQDGNFVFSVGNYEMEFENHSVVWTENTSNNTFYWKSEKTGYWENNALFRFAAYTDGKSTDKIAGVSYNPVTDVLTIPNYSVTDAANNNVKRDLLAAISGDRLSSENKGEVVFNFRHMLSKITLKLYNYSTNMDLVYSDINIGNIAKKGTCEFNYTNFVVNWKDLGESGAFCYADEVTLPYPTGSGNTHTYQEIDLYMIPQSSDKNITFSTVQKDGANNEALPTSYTANMSIESKTGTVYWKAGHHYVYYIQLGQTAETIGFDVTGVNGWITDINNSGGTDANDHIILNLQQQQNIP